MGAALRASQGQRGEMPPKRVLEPRTPRLGALGAAIEQTRKKAGLSQEELGGRTGINPSQLSGLERGARNPTYETLGQIADGLGTTIGKLTTRADRILSRRQG
jgi:transcriptional regulator with XRE-family HTH domain